MDYKNCSRNTLILKICELECEIASYIMRNSGLDLKYSMLERKYNNLKEKNDN